MIIHGYKKIIAIMVLITFIGTGLAWAGESTPRFQEKAGTPVVKKHKKIPLLLVAGGLVVLGAVVYLVTKKKTPTPPPVQDVTLNIDVYNHTKAKLLDDYKITAKAGSVVNLTRATLNVNGVKNEYLILRKLHSGETPGEFVKETNSGTLAVTVPNANTDYDLFLMNDSAAPYDRYFASCNGAKRLIWNMFRWDWDQTGPQAPLSQAIARLNTGLTKNGMIYGKINEVATGNQTNGDVRYGYQNLASGWHSISDNWWSVNSAANETDREKYLIAMSESSELLTQSNDFIDVVMGDLENGVMDDALCFQFLRTR